MLPLPTLSPPVTAKQRVVMIPADQPEEGIDSYGEKSLRKGKSQIMLTVKCLFELDSLR